MIATNSAPLTELVVEINSLHAEVLAVDLVGLERALHIGKLLNELYASDLSPAELRSYTSKLSFSSYTQQRYRRVARNKDRVAACASISEAVELLIGSDDVRRNSPHNRKLDGKRGAELKQRVANGATPAAAGLALGVSRSAAYNYLHYGTTSNEVQRAKNAEVKRAKNAAAQARDAEAQAENIAALTRLLDEAQTLSRRIGREAESRTFKHAMKDCAREIGRARRAATRRVET